MFKRSVLPGNRPESGPILRGRIYPRRHTWPRERRATSSNPEGFRHWRTSCGSNGDIQVSQVQYAGLCSLSAAVIPANSSKSSRGCYVQAVPVLPTPRASTFMGTVRWHLRRSMQVSSVKTSVHGFGARASDRAKVILTCVVEDELLFFIFFDISI